MTKDTETIAALARELSDLFEAGPRISDDTGRPIRKIRDGAPDWAQDVCRAAHDGGSMLPDDWRYEMIESAADALADVDGDEDEARERLEEDCPVYTSELTRWLGSHVYRLGYCDEATREYGPFEGIANTIQAGFVVEQTEVLSQLVRALADVETGGDL